MQAAFLPLPEWSHYVFLTINQTEEIAGQIKWLPLHKQERLSLNPQYPCKKPSMAACICSPSNKGEGDTGRSSSLLANQSGQSWTSGVSERNNQSIGWGMIEEDTCHWSLASLHTRAHIQHTHVRIYRCMLNDTHTPQTSNLVPTLKWNAMSQSFGTSTKCKQALWLWGRVPEGIYPAHYWSQELRTILLVCLHPTQYLRKEQMPESRTVLDWYKQGTS